MAWTTPKRIPSSSPSCAHHVRPPRRSAREPVCLAAPADLQEVHGKHRQRHHDFRVRPDDQGVDPHEEQQVVSHDATCHHARRGLRHAVALLCWCQSWAPRALHRSGGRHRRDDDPVVGDRQAEHPQHWPRGLRRRL
eukprot:3743299-Heterocapsa_arctica.AAC.1